MNAPLDSESLRMLQLFNWVAQHTDALCPSSERLKQYQRDPNSPETSDLKYHVDIARCHFCNPDPLAALPPFGESSECKVESSSEVDSQDGALGNPEPFAESLREEVNSAFAKLESQIKGKFVTMPEAHALGRTLGEDPKVIADMIFNETWINVLSRLMRKPEPILNWYSYILTAAKNLAIDILRRERNSPQQYPEAELPSDDSSPVEIALLREKRNRQYLAVRGALGKFYESHHLTPPQRITKEIYERRCRLEAPQDIADAMGFDAERGRSRVDTLFSRANKRIARLIEEEDKNGSLFHGTPGGFTHERGD